MAPTATKTAPEVDVEPEAERSFVVLASAIIIQVGPKSTQTARYTRGTIVPESAFARSDLDKMLAMRSIAVNDGQPKRKTTAQDLVNAAGALEDDIPIPAVDHSLTEDETRDVGDPDAKHKTEKQDAPAIEHIDAEDGFGVQA